MELIGRLWRPRGPAVAEAVGRAMIVGSLDQQAIARATPDEHGRIRVGIFPNKKRPGRETQDADYTILIDAEPSDSTIRRGQW